MVMLRCDGDTARDGASGDGHAVIIVMDGTTGGCDAIGHNGDSVQAYTARPLGPGPFPGVVLIHHLPGWDELYREWTRKFAHHGYAAISHNLYERFGEGSADDVAAKARAEGGVSDDQMVGDTEAATQWLKAQLWCTGKIGVIGSCSGGRVKGRS